MATPDQVFLNAAHLLEPRLEQVDDESVRGFGRAGCEAADAAVAQGLDVRTGFSAFVVSMRINAEREPSQRENAKTLQALARAGVFAFCPQYLDDADALEVPL